MAATRSVDAPEKNIRDILTTTAVNLLEEQGPGKMTARGVTNRADTSTMAVYTHFGSMGGLVASVVDHGFARLHDAFTAAPTGDDPLTNLWHTVETTRNFAHGHRHLYSVMFAAESIGSYERTGDELRQGSQTLRFLHGRCRDAISAGHFDVPNTLHATRQVWATMHGFIMLELAGYTTVEPDTPDIFADAIARSFVGLGADRDAAVRAVSRATSGAE